MIRVLCDCGHQEFESAFEVIGDKKLCKECWKNYQYSHGQVEEGCMFPEVAACSDREPSVLGELELKPKIKCYRGHAACAVKMENSKRLLCVAGKINEGCILCPHEGCGLILSIVKLEQVQISICSKHGIIFRAMIEPQD